MSEQKIIEEMIELIVKMGSIALIIFSIWITTIAYIATGNFQEKNDKTVWVIITIFLGPLGCILFWTVGRKKIVQNVQYKKQKENGYKIALTVILLAIIIIPEVLKFNKSVELNSDEYLKRSNKQEKINEDIAKEREESRHREQEYIAPKTSEEQPVEIRRPIEKGLISNKSKNNEEIYYYIDKNGIPSFTDNHNSIPSDAKEVENRSDKNKSQGTITKIKVENDHVYVPVKIRNNNNDYFILMLVDTGATGVMIHHDAASKMNIQNMGSSYSIVADGRKVPNWTGKVDKITVGTAEMENLEVSVMYSVSPQKHDGLLGMRFLKNFNYTIDLRRQEIQWN